MLPCTTNSPGRLAHRPCGSPRRQGRLLEGVQDRVSVAGMVLHYQRKPFDLGLLHTSNIPDNRRGGTGSNNTLLLKGVTYKEGNLPLFTSLLEEVFSESEVS